MRRIVKRAIKLYLLVLLCVILSSFFYLFTKSYLVFIVIVISSFLISYFGSSWKTFFFGAKIYNGKYQKDLFAISAQMDIKLENILTTRSSYSSASAFGLGNKKVICITSNLLNNHPPEEIEAVILHEIAHHKNKDIYLYTIAAAITLIITSWINVSFYSLFLTNWIYFFIASLITTFVFVLFLIRLSRWREAEADNFVKKHLSNPKKLAQFFEHLVKIEEEKGNKVSQLPPSFFKRLLLTHPAIHQRIKFLRQSK